ncbi:MAG: dephospho-CoA kinase [Chitinophagales bacterium]|nr:dephospho-CoA kinase [Chitinophagales bacterium]
MKTHKTALRVGITGNIGSGKTTVCRMFEALGIPVYYADDAAKWLSANDPDVKAAIIGLLGPEAYTPEGAYNRAYVAQIVFANKEKLAGLNAILHPAVEQHSQDWHEQQLAALAPPYTLKEAALMIESGSYRHLDQLIVVTAPETLRLTRVVTRDGADAASVQARMQRQLAEEEKVQLADFIIVNDGSRLLTPQVWAIHQALCAKSFFEKNFVGKG